MPDSRGGRRSSGRKRSRGKPGEAFVRALLEHFEVNGREAIEKVMGERPLDYLRVVASILPKEAAEGEAAPSRTKIRRVLVRPGD